MSQTEIPVLVLGLSPNALGTVRALSSAGVEVSVIDRSPSSIEDTHRWMSSKTSLCEHKLFYDGTEEQLLDTLIYYANLIKRKAVIIPSGDNHVLFLSKHEAQLKQLFYFVIPDKDTLELLEDKGKFYAYAEEHNISIPKTLFQVAPEKIEEECNSLQFPVLLKPHYRDSRWDKHFDSQKALVFETLPKLKEKYAEVYHFHPELILQEVIPGNDSELFFSHVFIDDNSRVHGLWTGRKIRQHPIHYGTSTMAESIWVEEIAEATKKILSSLDYKGYASIEFKRDVRDDSYRIMEVTVARTWYPHYLGIGAGINIPFVWYSALCGNDIPQQPVQKDGVRWIDEYRDLHAATDYIAAKELTWFTFLKSYRSPRLLALCSLKDLKPGFYLMVKILHGFGSRINKLFKIHK